MIEKALVRQCFFSETACPLSLPPEKNKMIKVEKRGLTRLGRKGTIIERAKNYRFSAQKS